jgi:MFS transporter, DHA1 family, inner membrane transport protein
MTTPTHLSPGTPVPAGADPRVAMFAGFALILGGFGIGVAEFVTMGLLPQIAEGTGVDIPTAGHTISAYAVGVVVGAPVIAAWGARFPRRTVLVGLMAVFALGNLLAALAPGYTTLLAARFLSGLPHGAFLGLAALVAISLAPPGRSGRAVGTVMLGIPIATVVGVPTATWVGQALGWRTAYVGVAVVGVLTAVLVRLWVPETPGDREQSWRRELKAFASLQVWLTMAVGAIGFGGMFAMYSYIAPTVTEVTGLSQGWVPVFLFAFGVGSIAGTVIGGRMADWSVLRSLVLSGSVMALLLLTFSVTSQWTVPALLTLFAVSAVTGTFVIGLQLRLMSVAGPAKTLGAAMNHSSLNAANALGAWLGGLVIAAGYGYTAPSIVGAALAAGGVLVLGVSLLVHVRQTRPRAVAA